MQQSQFIRGKGLIIEEFQRNRKKVASGVAGRNFSFEPGFMYDLNNELEIDTKFKLSDLNYKILEEMVNQELKRKGLDYDIAYKDAAMQWELTKAELFADLEKEIANIKKEYTYNEEALNLLALENKKRGAELIRAKTEIDIQLEEYRTQLEEMEGTTGDYEVLLAEAKIRTAEKKLEIIPLLQQLINIENQIIEKNSQIIANKRTLLDKEVQINAKFDSLMEKDNELIGIYEQIANDTNLLIDKERAYLNKSRSIIPYKESLIETYNQIADINSLIADKHMLISDAETQIINAKKTVIDAQDIVLDTKMRLLDAESSNLLIQDMVFDTDTSLISVKLNNEALRGQYITAQYDEITLFPQLIDKENLYLNKTISVLPYKTTLVDTYNQIADINSLIADKHMLISDAETQISDEYLNKIIAKDSLLSVRTQIVTEETANIALKQVVTNNEFNTINAQGLILDIQESINDTKEQISLGELALINAMQIAIDKQSIAIAVQTDIIINHNQILATEADIILKQIDVVAQEAAIIIDYQQLIDIEIDISQEADAIVIVATDISNQVSTNISHSDILIDAFNTLNSEKNLTVDSEFKVINNEIIKNNTYKQLISTEQAVINYAIAVLQPEIQNFVSVLISYLPEISRQIAIQSDIATTKQAISNSSIQHISAIKSTLGAKQVLVSQIVALNDAVQNMVTNQVATLSNKYQEYITESANEVIETTSQLNLKKDIENIKNDIADLSNDIVSNEELLMDLEKDKISERIDIKNEEADIYLQALTNRVNKILQEVMNMTTYINNWDTLVSNLDSNRTLTVGTIKNNRIQSEQLKLNTQISSDTKLTNAKYNSITNKSLTKIREIRDKAQIEASMNTITAKLNHVLI